jgi:hypothetical protein
MASARFGISEDIGVFIQPTPANFGQKKDHLFFHMVDITCQTTERKPFPTPNFG